MLTLISEQGNTKYNNNVIPGKNFSVTTSIFGNENSNITLKVN